jgi:hypothetical protein
MKQLDRTPFVHGTSMVKEEQSISHKELKVESHSICRSENVV